MPGGAQLIEVTVGAGAAVTGEQLRSFIFVLVAESATPVTGIAELV